MSTQRDAESLYRRLGGYDVIAAVLDDLLARMRADPQFSSFSGGRSADSARRGRQLLVDQICELAGGPCVYIGRDMKSSHAGLGITEEVWQATLQHTEEALKKRDIGERERAEFLELFGRYKADIVEGAAPAP